MDGKQLRTSVLAVGAAVAIALSGTFAWQNLNQTVRNEVENTINPGGRLHDDFNGCGDGTTKDIYVENFGNQPIYARVRLDEYMEIGDGAGLRNGDFGFDAKAATSLVTGADIDNEATWTTHIPGTAANEGTETGFNDAAKTFHTYWTWTLGGKTVYMPTFNKNKDSLKADVNGTLDGTGSGTPYDDYHAYAVDEIKTATEYGNGDIPSETEVEHTAKETLTAQVITMAEYKLLSDAEKTALNAWVYDADGWAYWSQAIAPNTATGLLLDQISLTKELSDAWYYAINVVGQFVTADDLGRLDSTGFYDTASGTPPTDDALALLEYIGVNKGSYTVDIRNAENTSVKDTTVKIEPAGEAVFSLNVTSSPAGYTPDGSWSWESSDTSVATVSPATGETVTVSVPDTANLDDTATITATNTVDSALTAAFTVQATEDVAAITAKINSMEPGLTDTVTMSGVEWYVVAKDDNLSDTSGSNHKAALLLSKDVLEERQFDTSTPIWKDSAMRTYLNNTASGGWLNGKMTIQSKAVEVTVQTRSAYNSTTSDGGVSDKVFLLSEADVCGTSSYGEDKSPQAWEYAYNGARLDCFTDDNSRIGYLNGSAQYWWLRSPGFNSGYVTEISSSGRLECRNCSSTGGIRPAFWYNLD